MTSSFRVGIDASNLRLGGGITHLVELLRAADPAAHDITGSSSGAVPPCSRKAPRQPRGFKSHARRRRAGRIAGDADLVAARRLARSRESCDALRPGGADPVAIACGRHHVEAPYRDQPSAAGRDRRGFRQTLRGRIKRATMRRRERRTSVNGQCGGVDEIEPLCRPSCPRS